MNKEITVIDLFKRIEKHEDIPKKIKYKDNCYMFKHTNYSIDHLYVLIGHESIGWLEHKDKRFIKRFNRNSKANK